MWSIGDMKRNGWAKVKIYYCNTDLFPFGRRSKPRRECKYVPRIQGGYPSQLQRAKSGGTAYDYYHVGWRFCHCGNCGTAV